MRVRFGDWIKTTENSYVKIQHVVELELLQVENPRDKNADDFEVKIMLTANEFWLPDKQVWEDGSKSHSIQISDPHHRDIFRGTRSECEKVIGEIIA